MEFAYTDDCEEQRLQFNRADEEKSQQLHSEWQKLKLKLFQIRKSHFV